MKGTFYLFLLMAFGVGVCAQNTSDAYSKGVEGIKLVDKGEFTQGIKLLKQARNLEPHDFDYSFEIGKAYLKSGDPKKAEKYLFPLQYHSKVLPGLFIELANCYREIEDGKKTPDPERKKELDALRYGIQKLPEAGILYLELANAKLEMEQPLEALAVFENGISKAPNFAENYFWAAKLMKAAGNDLWAWIYAEVFFNMSDDEEMKRTAALLISDASQVVFSTSWKPDPDKMDQELHYMLSENCKQNSSEFNALVATRICLLENWGNTSFPISSILTRTKEIRSKGLLEAYLATIHLESDKATFLSWVSGNAKTFEDYRKWRYWNPLIVTKSIQRISE